MKYNPTLAEVQQSPHIFYSVVAGSKAYGLDTPESDTDIRGYYHVPHKYRGNLIECSNQAQDDGHDIVYFSLKRAFELLMTANPNQIELLWIPWDCTRIYNLAIMNELKANRDLFISQAAYDSHFAFATNQIRKARGCNKRVNNPQPKEKPTKEDFCWFVDVLQYAEASADWGVEEAWPTDYMPCRPKKFSKAQAEFAAKPLSEYNCAKMEHMENTYRLYTHDRPKGVFRGPNEQLVCESIPKDEEWFNFAGILTYNEHAWKSACKEHKAYWDWMANRNESRWVDEEKGNLDYNAKNMSHCLRLMMSAKHILTEGYPLVRFEGEQREHLMAVKRGELEYDEIIEEVDALQKEIDIILPKTKVKKDIDFDKVNALFEYISQLAEKELVR